MNSKPELLAWAPYPYDKDGNKLPPSAATYQTLEEHLRKGIGVIEDILTTYPGSIFFRDAIEFFGIDFLKEIFLHHDDGKGMVGYQKALRSYLNFIRKGEGKIERKPRVRHEVISTYLFLRNKWDLKEEEPDKLAFGAASILLHHDSMLISTRLRASGRRVVSLSWLDMLSSSIGEELLSEELESLHAKLSREFNLPAHYKVPEKIEKDDFMEKMLWLSTYVRRPLRRTYALFTISKALHVLVVADNLSSQGRGGSMPKVMQRVYSQLFSVRGGEDAKKE